LHPFEQIPPAAAQRRLAHIPLPTWFSIALNRGAPPAPPTADWIDTPQSKERPDEQRCWEYI
jgi:hypothetical protein